MIEMSMKQQRAEALRLCLSYLWDGGDRGSHNLLQNTPHVCIALRVVVWDHPHLSEAAAQQIRHIASLLGKCETVRDWLADQGYIGTRDQIQAYRKAWVEHMIKELEA